MRESVAAVALLASTACTKNTVYYCDENTPCQVPGTICNLDQNNCVEAPDGPAGEDGPMPDADAVCALAGGQMVFERRVGAGEPQRITRMLADGSMKTDLTENSWPDFSPHVSPDGNAIAWLSEPAGEPHLWVMGSNGASQVEVAPLHVGRHVWSPSSNALAFSATISGNGQVHVVGRDGTGLMNLSANNFQEAEMSWAPDNSMIVFSTNRDGVYEIYSMKADGTSQDRLTTQGGARLPSWSPSGTLIAFLRSNALWTMTPLGGNQNMLFPGAVDSYEWSPDGSRIVVASANDIFTAALTGAGITNLTNDATQINGSPHWSPDGARIVFSTVRDGDFEIYVMEADGSSPVNLTNDPTSTDFNPSWGPCP